MPEAPFTVIDRFKLIPEIWSGIIIILEKVVGFVKSIVKVYVDALLLVVQGVVLVVTFRGAERVQFMAFVFAFCVVLNTCRLVVVKSIKASE